jgi:hypothetical protein
MSSDSLAGSPPILAAISGNRRIGSEKFSLKYKFHHVPERNKTARRAR